MRTPGVLSVLACVIGLSATRCVPGSSHVADPEDGRVTRGVYSNAYFGLSYALPPGWGEDVGGPGPSPTGYYVLMSLKANSGPAGTLLIAAQDLFFTAKPPADVMTVARDFRDAMSRLPAMTIEREPSETVVDGRRIVRVDYSGVGLHRAMIATTIRCHIMTFNLMTQDRGALAGLARGVALAVAVGPNIESSAPDCVRDYAVAENLVARVEPANWPGPAPTGPRPMPIPARLTVATDGAVRHVHVIGAAREQQTSIADALRQWRFKPYRRDGRAVEIETGVVLKPAAR